MESWESVRREVEQTIAKLKRTGEYEQWLAADPDPKGRMRRILASRDLTDGEVEELLASVAEDEVAAATVIASEVARAVARTREPSTVEEPAPWGD